MKEIKRASLAEAIEKARETGRYIKKQMPLGWGFFIILAEFNQDEEAGAMTYLSSCERASAIKILREMADKLETETPEISSTN